MKVAVVFGTKAGVGGLGHSAASAIAALADGRAEVHAFGPGAHRPWSLGGEMPRVNWHVAPQPREGWVDRQVLRRWQPGRQVLARDRALGKWACNEVKRLRPDAIYLFTQVALETLRWAQAEGIPTMLDNPNGHIRNFAQVLRSESLRLCGRPFVGHPIDEMVERVEEEYALTDAVHMYSEWGRRSMTAFGVAEAKLVTLLPSMNLQRYAPGSGRRSASGPLRLCYAGSLDLRKGFVHLLRAIRKVGADRVHLQIVGATGDRDCAKLFAHESAGLSVHCAPGDPVAAYQAAEVFVLPTMEDGLPFVLAEAMAAGLPSIVTTEAGAGECIRLDESGWRVPAGDADALAAAIEHALGQRHALAAMGREARRDAEHAFGPDRLSELADSFYSVQ